MKFKKILILIFSLILVLIVMYLKDNREVNGMNQKETIKLPEPEYKSKISLEETIYKRRSIRSFTKEPLTIQMVSQLLWSIQGITDSYWGLRTAPSAGALYPLEIYILVGSVKNLEQGLYKYIPQNHSLMKILDDDKRNELYNAALQQESIIEAPVNFVVSAVFQRTAKKYGSRAERYVWLEAGHAAQNLLLQATALNLGAVPIGAFHDDNVKTSLKLNKNEEPLYIIPIGKR